MQGEIITICMKFYRFAVPRDLRKNREIQQVPIKHVQLTLNMFDRDPRDSSPGTAETRVYLSINRLYQIKRIKKQ